MTNSRVGSTFHADGDDVCAGGDDDNGAGVASFTYRDDGIELHGDVQRVCAGARTTICDTAVLTVTAGRHRR